MSEYEVRALALQEKVLAALQQIAEALGARARSQGEEAVPGDVLRERLRVLGYEVDAARLYYLGQKPGVKRYKRGGGARGKKGVKWIMPGALRAVIDAIEGGRE